MIVTIKRLRSTGLYYIPVLDINGYPKDDKFNMIATCDAAMSHAKSLYGNAVELSVMEVDKL